jgi:hypothetical protein
LFVKPHEDMPVPEVEGPCELAQHSLGRLGRLCTSVVDPDPDTDPDPVGSGTFCRIRIRNRIRNKSFRIRIRPIRIRNEFYP